MIKRLVIAFILVISVISNTSAAQDPTVTGPENQSERHFVSIIRSVLLPRYATVDEALAAGYVRYTSEDDSGAISYVNQHWVSTGVSRPSQLWYDKNGRLLGADFSIPLATCAHRPNLWGVRPGRWSVSDSHIHWVTRNAAGALSYDHYMLAPAFAAAGGNPNDPTAAQLASMRKVTSAKQVALVFHFPALWDLDVWIVPNPHGAFADTNPNVKP
jgi:hypothetical protein